MTLHRALLPACALALATAGGLSAADTPAALACNRSGSTSRYGSCYDPYERVGPVRRMWRALFRAPCPPRPVLVPVPVAAAPVCGPAAGFPAGPPPNVEIGRPSSAVPGEPPAPPPSPPGPFAGSSRAAPPAASPAPLRFERMASRAAAPAVTVRAAAPERVRVLLINAERTSLRHRFVTDDKGGVTADVAGGEWLIYTQNDEGALTFRGKVKASDGRPTRVDLPR